MKRYYSYFLIVLIILVCIIVINLKLGKKEETKSLQTVTGEDEVVYSNTTDRLELFQPLYNLHTDIVDTKLIANFGGSQNKWKAHMAVQQAMDNDHKHNPCWRLCNFVKFISVDVQFDSSGNIVHIQPRQDVIYDGDYIIIVGDDGYSHQFGVLGPLD